MKVTYIHHSGFLVELERVSLLFDYVEGELPALDAEKPLLVFVSHRHGDHFSPEIFSLVCKYPKTTYIISDDIWQNRIPEECYSRVEFMDAGMEITVPGEENVRISAYKSTDEGVAFLVEAEGKLIFHAGDLNDWSWKGEAEDINRKMQAAYLKELDKLANHRIDVAFVPLDGRQEDWFYLGLWEFMDKVGAGIVFPMHFWDDYSVIGKFKKMDSSKAYADRIVEIHKRGEVFML